MAEPLRGHSLVWLLISALAGIWRSELLISAGSLAIWLLISCKLLERSLRGVLALYLLSLVAGLIWDAEADAAWEALQADPTWDQLAALRAEPVSLAASVSAAAAEIRAAGDEAHQRGVVLAASMLAAIDAELALY